MDSKLFSNLSIMLDPSQTPDISDHCLTFALPVETIVGNAFSQRAMWHAATTEAELLQAFDAILDAPTAAALSVSEVNSLARQKKAERCPFWTERVAEAYVAMLQELMRAEAVAPAAGGDEDALLAAALALSLGEEGGDAGNGDGGVGGGGGAKEEGVREFSEFDLIPNGRDIDVTNANRHQYVNLMARHKMESSITDQLAALVGGCRSVYSFDTMSVFLEKDLDVLLNGEVRRGEEREPAVPVACLG